FSLVDGLEIDLAVVQEASLVEPGQVQRVWQPDIVQAGAAFLRRIVRPVDLGEENQDQAPLGRKSLQGFDLSHQGWPVAPLIQKLQIINDDKRAARCTGQGCDQIAGADGVGAVEFKQAPQHCLIGINGEEAIPYVLLAIFEAEEFPVGSGFYRLQRQL